MRDVVTLSESCRPLLLIAVNLHKITYFCFCSSFWSISIYENPCIMCMRRSNAHWNLKVLWLTSVQVFILYFQPTWFKAFIYIRTVSCGYGDPRFWGPPHPQIYIDLGTPSLNLHRYGDPHPYIYDQECIRTGG